MGETGRGWEGPPRWSCSVCTGSGVGGRGPTLGLGFVSQCRLLCSVSLVSQGLPELELLSLPFPRKELKSREALRHDEHMLLLHAGSAALPPRLPPGRSRAGSEKPPRGGLPRDWLSPRPLGEPTLVPALRAVTRQPGDSGQDPPSLCRLQQARHTRPTRRPGTGVLRSGPPRPWAQPAHDEHLIHTEAEGTSRTRNVAAAEEVWTPRECPANPSGHRLGDGAHTFLGQGALGPTVASPEGPRISEAWGQG